MKGTTYHLFAPLFVIKWQLECKRPVNLTWKLDGIHNKYDLLLQCDLLLSFCSFSFKVLVCQKQVNIRIFCRGTTKQYPHLRNFYKSLHFSYGSTVTLKKNPKAEFPCGPNLEPRIHRTTEYRTLFYVALHLAKSYFTGSLQINR